MHRGGEFAGVEFTDPAAQSEEAVGQGVGLVEQIGGRGTVGQDRVDVPRHLGGGEIDVGGGLGALEGRHVESLP